VRRTRPDANFVAEQAQRMTELLQPRGNLSVEDREYAAEKLEKLKDERLQGIFVDLIGWGDDERAEVETFVAIAIEVLKRTNTSKIRECAQIVELRHLMRDMK
jgi:hypothetical protein